MKSYKDTIFLKEETIQRNMLVSDSLSIIRHKFELPYLMREHMNQVRSTLQHLASNLASSSFRPVKLLP
jgi:hypothetical protein